MIKFQSFFRLIYIPILWMIFYFFNRITCRNILPNWIANFFELNRMRILRALGMKGGRDAYIRTNFWCNKPSNVSIGNRGTIAINCQFYAYEKITIGNHFLLGSDIIIHTAEHNYIDQDIPIIDQGATYKPVVIGNNVYIGSKVIILPGAVIEDNVIVGAGAVVNGYLEQGFFYAGVPAKKIRALYA